MNGNKSVDSYLCLVCSQGVYIYIQGEEESE